MPDPAPVSDSSSRPPVPTKPPSVHAQRRASGGPRHASSSRVTLRGGTTEVVAWMLNVSRGGSRVVVEEPVEPHANYIMVTDDDQAPRAVRVVWVREESGGQIVGLQFLDCDGTVPPAEESDVAP
jgi:hypothetical protein